MPASSSGWPSWASPADVATAAGSVPTEPCRAPTWPRSCPAPYSLPDGPDPGFTDVAADAWYAADVAKLAASGITVGCGDGTRFCPDRDTTHGQMATFLHRAERQQVQE